jgi:tetrahydromethanopterin S-methyltransferase subunit A
MTDDPEKGWVTAARAEIAEGMAHEKCHACGCMHDGLARLERVLEATEADLELLSDVRDWQAQLTEQDVDCRGCPHCYPAEATNRAMEAINDPQLITADTIPEEGQRDRDDQPDRDSGTPIEWPPIPGDYHAMCTGADCPVAVSTLGDDALADELAANAPEELCIVGQTRTENTGIEKLLKNVVSNPTIQILVLAGSDPDGHRSGETMKALLEAGVTEDMQITDAPGRRPVLANTTPAEVQTFREQVELTSSTP